MNCAKCDVDPRICEECNPGFWLDLELNSCVDKTCSDSNCVVCDSEGPNGFCDQCEEEYVYVAA